MSAPAAAAAPAPAPARAAPALNLDNAVLVAWDLETVPGRLGGPRMDAPSSRPIQFGAVTLRGGFYERTCDPGVTMEEIPPSTLAWFRSEGTYGAFWDGVSGGLIDAAPFADVWRGFEAMLLAEARRVGARDVVMVAHNGRGWDEPILFNALARAGLVLTDALRWHWVDSLALARSALDVRARLAKRPPTDAHGRRRESAALQALLKATGVRVPGRAHTAGADAAAIWVVLAALSHPGGIATRRLNGCTDIAGFVNTLPSAIDLPGLRAQLRFALAATPRGMASVSRGLWTEYRDGCATATAVAMAEATSEAAGATRARLCDLEAAGFTRYGPDADAVIARIAAAGVEGECERVTALYNSVARHHVDVPVPRPVPAPGTESPLEELARLSRDLVAMSDRVARCGRPSAHHARALEHVKAALVELQSARLEAPTDADPDHDMMRRVSPPGTPPRRAAPAGRSALGAARVDIEEDVCPAALLAWWEDPASLGLSDASLAVVQRVAMRLPLDPKLGTFHLKGVGPATLGAIAVATGGGATLATLAGGASVGQLLQVLCTTPDSLVVPHAELGVLSAALGGLPLSPEAAGVRLGAFIHGRKWVVEVVAWLGVHFPALVAS